jgi:hypothetical protein
MHPCANLAIPDAVSRSACGAALQSNQVDPPRLTSHGWPNFVVRRINAIR